MFEILNKFGLDYIEGLQIIGGVIVVSASVKFGLRWGNRLFDYFEKPVTWSKKEKGQN